MLGEEERRKILEYVERLGKNREWGSLTSKRSASEPGKLIEETLEVMRVINENEKRKVIEIGSGGGVVGIVLAIACPEWSLTLVESSKRKCAFLAETIGAMKLENAAVINARAEELEIAGKYDAVVTRAAGRIKDLAPTALAMLREGGTYVAIKGARDRDEVFEVEPDLLEWGGKLVGTINTPGSEEKDAPGVLLVVIEKM